MHFTNIDDDPIILYKRIIYIFNKCKINKSNIIFAYNIYNRVKDNSDIIDLNTTIEVFICCICISMKYLEDNHYSNKYWCRTFYLNFHFFDELEIKILKIINYDLYFNNSEYFDMFLNFNDLVNKINPIKSNNKSFRKVHKKFKKSSHL